MAESGWVTMIPPLNEYGPAMYCMYCGGASYHSNFMPGLSMWASVHSLLHTLEAAPRRTP